MAKLTVLDDGQMHFKIRNRATGEEQEHAIDVLMLRLACEECEIVHHLEVNDRGEYKATSAFLNDLAGRLSAMSSVTDCTPSIAMQLWSASVREIESLKKNTNETPNSPSGLESSQPEAAMAEPSLAENASGY